MIGLKSLVVEHRPLQCYQELGQHPFSNLQVRNPHFGAHACQHVLGKWGWWWVCDHVAIHPHNKIHLCALVAKRDMFASLFIWANPKIHFHDTTLWVSDSIYHWNGVGQMNASQLWSILSQVLCISLNAPSSLCTLFPSHFPWLSTLLNLNISTFCVNHPHPFINLFFTSVWVILTLLFVLSNLLFMDPLHPHIHESCLPSDMPLSLHHLSSADLSKCAKITSPNTFWNYGMKLPFQILNPFNLEKTCWLGHKLCNCGSKLQLFLDKHIALKLHGPTTQAEIIWRCVWLETTSGGGDTFSEASTSWDDVGEPWVVLKHLFRSRHKLGWCWWTMGGSEAPLEHKVACPFKATKNWVSYAIHEQCTLCSVLVLPFWFEKCSLCFVFVLPSCSDLQDPLSALASLSTQLHGHLNGVAHSLSLSPCFVVGIAVKFVLLSLCSDMTCVQD